jgi:hypothetical protein
MPKLTMSFARWIRSQVHRSDTVGLIARELVEDTWFQQTPPPTLKEIHDYIMELRVSNYVTDAFNDAREEYQHRIYCDNDECPCQTDWSF